jgi:hypothetical protein
MSAEELKILTPRYHFPLNGSCYSLILEGVYCMDGLQRPWLKSNSTSTSGQITLMQQDWELRTEEVSLCVFNQVKM